QLSGSAAGFVARHLEQCSACQALVKRQPAKTSSDSVPPSAAKPARAQGLSSTALPGQSKAPASLPPPAGIPPALANHSKVEVSKLLGQGGMGAVYLARHRVMDRPVAIKIINRSLLDNPDALTRFFAEVRAAAKLMHPNIVAAYDAEQADDLHL